MSFGVYEIYAKGMTLNDLLEWCIKHESPNRFMLGLMLKPRGKRMIYDKTAAAALSQLIEDRYLAHLMTDHWPGTECKGCPNLMVIGRMDENVAKQMVEMGNDLMAWQNRAVPPLPEDLCLFTDGHALPTLFSASHENLVWITSRKVPPFRVSRKYKGSEKELVSKLEIPQSEYYCEPWREPDVQITLPPFCG